MHTLRAPLVSFCLSISLSSHLAAQSEPVQINGLEPTFEMVQANDALLDGQQRLVDAQAAYGAKQEAGKSAQDKVSAHLAAHAEQQDTYRRAQAKYTEDYARLYGALEDFLKPSQEAVEKADAAIAEREATQNALLSAIEGRTEPMTNEEQSRLNALSEEIKTLNVERADAQKGIQDTYAGLDRKFDADRAALEDMRRAISDKSIDFYSRLTELRLAERDALFALEQSEEALARTVRELEGLTATLRAVLIKSPPNHVAEIVVHHLDDKVIYAAEWAPTGVSIALDAKEKTALRERVAFEKETSELFVRALDELYARRSRIGARLSEAHQIAGEARDAIGESVYRQELSLVALEIAGTVATAYMTAGTSALYTAAATKAASEAGGVALSRVAKTAGKEVAENLLELTEEQLFWKTMREVFMAEATASSALMAKTFNGEAAAKLNELQGRLGTEEDLGSGHAGRTAAVNSLVGGEMVETLVGAGADFATDIAMDQLQKALGREAVSSGAPDPSTMPLDLAVIAAKAAVVYSEMAFRDQLALEEVRYSVQAITYSEMFNRNQRALGRVLELQAIHTEFVASLELMLEQGRPVPQLRVTTASPTWPAGGEPLRIRVTFANSVDGTPMLKGDRVHSAFGRSVDAAMKEFEFNTTIADAYALDGTLRFGFNGKSGNWSLLDTDPSTVPRLGSFYEAAWDNVEAGWDENHQLCAFAPVASSAADAPQSDAVASTAPLQVRCQVPEVLIADFLTAPEVFNCHWSAPRSMASIAEEYNLADDAVVFDYDRRKVYPAFALEEELLVCLSVGVGLGGVSLVGPVRDDVGRLVLVAPEYDPNEGAYSNGYISPFHQDWKGLGNEIDRLLNFGANMPAPPPPDTLEMPFQIPVISQP